MRDRPIFSLELDFQHSDQAKVLLQEVLQLDYIVQLVPEVCGVRRSLRNVICVPKERLLPPRTRQALRNGSVVVDQHFVDDIPIRCPKGALCLPIWYKDVFGPKLVWDHSRVMVTEHCRFVRSKLKCLS